MVCVVQKLRCQTHVDQVSQNKSSFYRIYIGALNLILDLDLNFLYWLGLFGHSLLRQNRPSITTNLYWPAHYVLYSDERTHIRGSPRSVRIAHKKAQRRSMSLMHRGICGRKVGWRWIALWPMLDGEPEVGYTPVFLFFLFVFVILYLRKPTVFLLRTLTRLPSNPPIAWFLSWSSCCYFILLTFYIASLLQQDLNQCAEQRTSDLGISKERRDEVRFVFNPLSSPIIAHPLAWFHRTSLEGPHTRNSKIDYNSDSAVLLCDRECGWGHTSLGTLIVICAHTALVWSLIHLLRPYKL